MAHVNFDGLNLRVTLAPPERRAVHRREFVAARSQLAGVRHALDLWSLVRHDVTVLGLGYTGMLMWGTALNRAGQDFCILHAHGPGLEVQLRDSPYERLLLSMPDSLSWPLFVRLREVVMADADGPAGR